MSFASPVSLLTVVCLVATAYSNDIPLTMAAAVASGSAPAGDFSKISILSQQTPSPGTGQVLISVNASSVNPVDWKVIEEPSPWPISFPHVLGFDVAGTVAALGPGCSRLKVGDRVWTDLGGTSGAYAQYAVAAESQVGVMPSSMSFEEAASVPLVALTDIQALRKVGAPWTPAVGANFSVVVTSGAGGTGVAAVQMAKALGATFVATAASSEHAPLLKALGADLVVDYHQSTLWAALQDNSIDVVYDNYGAPRTADAAMASLKPGGSFVFLPGKGASLSKQNEGFW
eukprot:TRINITY_DN2462_c0_g1_i3.p1 TRINITY_DN2462_c0_g1~~TRINITY_DN2462_c0_g1_i3.p1  ORF type:complete len:287 (-),score=56.44 TRINITY_DN2462_c0_g1_i3:500-1360(-)